MKNPIIGLTPQYDFQKNRIWMRHQYTDSIILSGGLPILLIQYVCHSDISAAADLLDGVFFTGGVDIHPKYYGEEVMPGCGEISETRDIFELTLYSEAVKRNMPVFGLCRGIQLINVGAGGTLYQHIGGHSDGVFHKINIERNSMLYAILKTDTLTVNSYHHQAVKLPAPGMKADAYTEENDSEKIIEAIESQEMFFNISVQWHPEYTYNDDEYSRKLFSAFVSACDTYSKNK